MQAYLPALLETREGTVAAQAHAALQSSLQVFTSAAHADWYQSIGPDLTERLKRPLLKQVGAFRCYCTQLAALIDI